MNELPSKTHPAQQSRTERRIVTVVAACGLLLSAFILVAVAYLVFFPVWLAAQRPAFEQPFHNSQARVAPCGIAPGVSPVPSGARAAFVPFHIHPLNCLQSLTDFISGNDRTHINATRASIILDPSNDADVPNELRAQR